MASSTSAGGRRARARRGGGGVSATRVGLATGALVLALDDVAVARERLEVRASAVNVLAGLEVEGTTDIIEVLKVNAKYC